MSTMPSLLDKFYFTIFFNEFTFDLTKCLSWISHVLYCDGSRRLAVHSSTCQSLVFAVLESSTRLVHGVKINYPFSTSDPRAQQYSNLFYSIFFPLFVIAHEKSFSFDFFVRTEFRNNENSALGTSRIFPFFFFNLNNEKTDFSWTSFSTDSSENSTRLGIVSFTKILRKWWKNGN